MDPPEGDEITFSGGRGGIAGAGKDHQIEVVDPDYGIVKDTAGIRGRDGTGETPIDEIPLEK